MKSFIRLIVLPGLCGSLALLSAFPAHAQPYLKTDVGGQVTLDTDLKEFFGPVTPGSKVKFDPGFRAGIGGGFQLTDWLAFEGEIGVMANNISSITDASRVDAWFEQVPFLANVKLQLPGHHRLTPYIGGGAGFSISWLSANEITIGGTTLNGTASSDAVFAYQAFAGLRYRINERMGLSVECRYFAADPTKWTADSAFDTSSNTMRFGGTQTCAMSLAFDFRF